jgi:hypothetical protein
VTRSSRHRPLQLPGPETNWKQTPHHFTQSKDWGGGRHREAHEGQRLPDPSTRENHREKETGERASERQTTSADLERVSRQTRQVPREPSEGYYYYYYIWEGAAQGHPYNIYYYNYYIWEGAAQGHPYNIYYYNYYIWEGATQGHP